MKNKEFAQRKAEMLRNISLSASMIKLVCGVANNAAWLVALEAYDHAKQCKRYRNINVRGEFKRIMKMYHAYESHLIFATKNRLFHIDDMSPETRKKYGAVSDREYYDFWTATGAQAYMKTRPLLTSLWNKYRLSLVNHHVSDAEHVAWIMVAQATFELAVRIYKAAMDDIINNYKVPRNIANMIFQQLSVENLSKQWFKAMSALSPDSSEFEFTPTEERNISLGIRQLHEAWSHPSIFFDSTAQAAEAYDDIFRTKGELRKTLAELKEMKEETMKELK